MCIPRKKKRKAIVLELPELVIAEDEPSKPVEPVVDSRVVVLPCPATQPRIHVKCSTCNKDVVGVKVTLAGVDLGSTGRDGKTAPKAGGMVPGKGAVLLVQGDRPGHVLTRDFEVTYPKLCTDTFLVEAKCVAHLVVEVMRYDGQPVLGGAVKFSITGPAGTENTTTAAFKGKDAQLARDVDEERKDFPAVAPGAYTITLADVPALLAAQKPTSTSTEVWKLGPVKDGVAKLTLKAGATHRACFVLTRIQKIQFIGFEIEPTDKGASGPSLPSGKIYHGDADADVDIGDRSIILKHAIKQALGHNKVKPEPEVLKVFMTAEFYWRGKDGAYPLQKMSKIMDAMREEVAKPEYKDWLFVHGTAIGYLKHGGTTPTVRQLAIKGASGSAAASFEVVDLVGSKDRVGVCAEIPANWDLGDLSKIPEYRWTLRQGTKEAHVVKCTPGTGSYTLAVHAAVAFTDGVVELLEPAATEVFNVALVQRGGPGTGVAGVREAIVYKEDISAIDYLSVMFGKHDEFHQRSGDNRKIEVHGEERRALPTSGSRDVLGASPNAPTSGGVSERTQHGLGGGSIFEMDGITFGLEICRDHLQGKLKKYFHGDPKATPPTAAAASPGDPRVQVQLIPSWGASITDAAICGTDGVLVFNVDGPAGAAAGGLGGPLVFECPDHPGPTSPTPADCATSHYRCWGISPIAKKCPHCTRPMSKTIADFYCTKPDHLFWALPNCAHCGAATQFDCFRCPECSSVAPALGPCDNGPCVGKPARVEVRYCDVARHRHGAPCTGHGAPAWYCTAHTHITKTSGNCGTCSTEKLATKVAMKANLAKSTGSPGAPVTDAPGSYTKVTESEVADSDSPTGKKATYTTTTVARSPKQTDYFKADGKLVVYPPLDLPDAQTV